VFVEERDAYSLAAELLRSARENAGLSQAEFAARVGVPRTMVSAYERGVRQATLPTLQRLLRAAGYEVQLVLVPTEGADDIRRAEPETRRGRGERAR
jgi:transcriptional regulator with XRE-family HTH domain